MMRIGRFPLLLLALAAAAFAADVEHTSGGDLTITPVGHATILFQFEGRNWIVDPWSNAVNEASLPKADVILITDIHGDHMDPAAIAAVKKDSTVIIAPPAVAKTVTEAKPLANGASTTVDGVTIEAIPMYNLERGPSPGTVFHEKGRGDGFVLTMGDKRIYISGDTEVTDEMRALKNIDIAFVCMNLPYTMTPEEAAAGVKSFQPKVVYPYHYRGSDVQAFASALAGQPTEVRLRDWY